MLIEFSVSNYRSIREKRTLSMVAYPRLGKRTNLLKPELEGENFPSLLKVAAIYGPNASGKSSLIQALGFAGSMMRRKADPESYIPVHPFRFDKELASQPSKFEYNFISRGMRYEYVVEATKERIHRETLTSYPKGKDVLIYSRHFVDGEGEKYDFGSLEGGEIVHKAWRRLTSPRVLFLPQAIANSSDELQQLVPVSDWFRSSTLCIDQDSMTPWSIVARSYLHQHPEESRKLSKFLNKLDVPITEIRFDIVNAEKLTPSSWADDSILNSVEKDFKTKLTHTTDLGSAEFDFEDESGGTKNLIGFWLPWLHFGAGDGGFVAVDELDSSLHPKIVEKVVREHLLGKSQKQLIFTTHDTHLMKTKVLRRDQFWIAERDRYGATNLFSIHDFDGRDSEDVEGRYYAGRYRGLPLLKSDD